MASGKRASGTPIFSRAVTGWHAGTRSLLRWWCLSSTVRACPRMESALICAFTAAYPRSTASRHGSSCCIFRATRNTLDVSYLEGRTQRFWRALLCDIRCVTEESCAKRLCWSQRWRHGRRLWPRWSLCRAGCFHSLLSFHR